MFIKIQNCRAPVYPRLVKCVVSETMDTYDRIATAYARANPPGSGYPGFAEDIGWLRDAVETGGWVADVGCGPGNDVAVLRGTGLRVIGLDLSAGQLRAGYLPGVAQADMRALPLRPASMEGIWCIAALLHLPRPAVTAALDEFARVVRPGGVLCLTVAEGDGDGFEEVVNDDTPLRRWFTYHREEPLRELLATAGFRVAATRRARSHRDWLHLRAHRR